MAVLFKPTAEEEGAAVEGSKCVTFVKGSNILCLSARKEALPAFASVKDTCAASLGAEQGKVFWKWTVSGRSRGKNLGRYCIRPEF